MEILESLYEFEVKKLDFLERKISLDDDSLNLYGPPKSGKTYLVWHYLSTLPADSYIYIDRDDIRIDASVLEKLPRFTQENPLDCVVLDNWDDSAPPPLPADIQLLLVSKKPVGLSGLPMQYLPTLDFEEYMLFDHHQSPQITQTLGSFIKNGTLPQMARTQDELRPFLAQELIRSMFDSPVKEAIFLFLLRFVGSAFTLHQVFQKLKQTMKLSKDRFYYYIEELEHEGMLYRIPKFDQPRAPRKVYAYDFGLRNGVTFEKNFANVYENMILTELRKNYRDIAYLGMIDFYIHEEALGIIAMPFTSKDAVTTLLAKLPKETHLTQIEIITMGYEESFEYNGVMIDILPYWTWALKDEK